MEREQNSGLEDALKGELYPWRDRGKISQLVAIARRGELLSQLSDRFRLIIGHRYPEEGEWLSQAAVGKQIGVSSTRLGDLERQAISKVKELVYQEEYWPKDASQREFLKTETFALRVRDSLEIVPDYADLSDMLHSGVSGNHIETIPFEWERFRESLSKEEKGIILKTLKRLIQYRPPYLAPDEVRPVRLGEIKRAPIEELKSLWLTRDRETRDFVEKVFKN